MTPRRAPTVTPAPEAEPPACDATLSRAFLFLGKRWNGLLLGTLMHGPAGFAELKRGLGISDSMLSDRLNELTRANLVERSVDPGPPVTVTYALTADGKAISPVLEALIEWARNHLTEGACSGDDLKP
ncbi:winged helix-turn-helix transcriptional regulator [Gordonia hankookensis]|uniref:Helix-turn-helix transcriptional regulator n=1 Tax=Gordonia hankookensis TaxID=589403 RepID=A0ABR7WDT8_9ACTN|nr:helix-turn-helix domain-containing protein [Gordonia hankookensis]MBD1319919.1 helix-turn-helix transcriptional regulator [Gordonia hankookensis]NDZ94476.1 helix-turn-helix transcriptional regulator [Streptomyces sp. SID11726]NEB24576.1 helix-turn-helix transcriptional regulator [Streptomyces sp. SID6673]